MHPPIAAALAALAVVAAPAQAVPFEVTLEAGGGGMVIPESNGLSPGARRAGLSARTSVMAAMTLNPSFTFGARLGAGYRDGQFRGGWTDFLFGELQLTYTVLRNGPLTVGMESALGFVKQRSRDPDDPWHTSSLGYDYPILPLSVGLATTYRIGKLILRFTPAIESVFSTVFMPPSPPVLPGHSLPERSGGVGFDLGLRGTLSIGWGVTGR